jgi:peroxin-6
MILTPRSAKELEHFERIRQTFEAVDKSKQDPAAAAPQTIAEAMEAFSLGGSAIPEETPTINGDSHAPGGIHGRIKGLNKWPGNVVRSTSGQSTTSSKSKGKSVSKKGKSRTGAESDGSVDGDDEDMADANSKEDEDEDDYVVRTDHLRNPMEEVE